jgi:hypothetical protein
MPLRAMLFARIRRADPRHARSAVRHLLTVGRTVTVVQAHVQEGLEFGDARAIREAANLAAGGLEDEANKHLGPAGRPVQGYPWLPEAGTCGFGVDSERGGGD